MHDLVVDRHADHAGKAVIVEERRLSAALLELSAANTVDLAGGHAGLDRALEQDEDVGDDAPGAAHNRQFLARSSPRWPCS